jgi:hypothetical protein
VYAEKTACSILLKEFQLLHGQKQNMPPLGLNTYKQIELILTLTIDLSEYVNTITRQH